MNVNSILLAISSRWKSNYQLNCDACCYDKRRFEANFQVINKNHTWYDDIIGQGHTQEICLNIYAVKGKISLEDVQTAMVA